MPEITDEEYARMVEMHKLGMKELGMRYSVISDIVDRIEAERGEKEEDDDILFIGFKGLAEWYSFGKRKSADYKGEYITESSGRGSDGQTMDNSNNGGRYI